MKKLILILCLCLPLWATAQKWHAYSRWVSGTSAVRADSIIGSVADTTEYFELFPGSGLDRRAGDLVWEFYFTAIGTNTTIDTVWFDLYGADNDYATNSIYGKASSYWAFFKTYTNIALGSGLLPYTGSELQVIVDDTLSDVAMRYWRWIIRRPSDSANDSGSYTTQINGDKGVAP